MVTCVLAHTCLEGAGSADKGKPGTWSIDGPLATENKHWRASFLSVGLGLVSCNTM